MNNYTLNLKLQYSIGNLHRKRHVLLVIRDKNGRILVGHKPDFYPEGITRLPGGGINDNETPAEGALREAKEELGVDFTGNDLVFIGEVKIHAEAENGEYDLVTYLYFIQLKDQACTAGDDVAAFSALTVDELFALVEAYNSLSKDSWFIDGDYRHCWQDYGKVYGPIHKIAANWLVVKGLSSLVKAE